MSGPNDVRSKAQVVPLHAGTAAASSAEGAAKLFQGVVCEMPEKPEWLSEKAGAHWDYLAGKLFDAGLMSTLYQGNLAILCTAYARMWEAEIALQERGGVTQTTPNGYQQLSPEFVQFSKYSAQYSKLGGQFGLTPRACQQLKLEDPNQMGLDLD